MSGRAVMYILRCCRLDPAVMYFLLCECVLGANTDPSIPANTENNIMHHTFVPGYTDH